VILVAGLLAAVGSGFATAQYGHSYEIALTAAVVVLCAIWWVFEPVPIPVTSLVPLAVLPLGGVLTEDQLGACVGNKLVLLMMGGFMLSMAMEQSGTHRRLALNMVGLFGGGASSRKLVFGFMAASAFLSMWISNAATVLMLLPIVTAVVEKSSNRRMKVALLLGIAYAASVGGIVTPIGTPPNMVFMSVYGKAFGEEPSFGTWMIWAAPIAAIMLPLIGFWLTRGLQSDANLKMPETGSWRYEEIATLVVFGMTALLWITRKEPWGGWSEWLNLPAANDAAVALLAVVVMHFLPNGKGETLLTWDNAVKIPWGVLLLFAGGIAIANACIESGLSQQLGDALSGISALPLVLMIGGVCLAVTFLTEVTSNTATATLLLPILAATAISTDIDPRIIMIPATISASFAFMLPVATPPNAIVFGNGTLTVKDMMHQGLVLNLFGVAIVTFVCWLFFG
jgi:solute carrier family 13 (sodium-dependent dicarboxylate transporter), member 2/3/5